MDRKIVAVWVALFAVIGVVTFATRGAVFRSPAALLVVAAGAGAVAYGVRRKPRAIEARKNGLPAVNLILRVAKQHQGRITAAEVLAETDLSLDTVAHTLDELTLAGTCQLVVGQKGTQVYYFPEFESDAAKDELVS